jgi:hypothetical protein
MTPLAKVHILSLGILTLAACSDYQSNPAAPYPDPDPTPTTVDVAFCAGSQPRWVAFQDGDGEWSRAQLVAAGQLASFRHTFNSNRGAIATAREFANGLTALTIQYAAPAELAIAGDQRPDLCGLIADHTVLGTVAGIDTNEVVVVSTGRSTREATTLAEGSAFTLRQVGGPEELLATRLTRVDGEVRLTGIILRRGPELPDGATIPVLDFGSAEVIQPTLQIATLAGFGADGAVSRNGVRTAHSENVIIFGDPSVTAAARTYPAVPEDRLAPGELQFLTATTNATNTSNIVRSTTSYFRAPTARTLTFPDLPHAPALSLTATATSVRPRARFDSQPAYDRATAISYQQLQNTVVSVSMTPAYAAVNGGGYDLVVPDLAGVAGFDPRWALHPGNTLIWTSARIGGTLGLAPNVIPADGDTRTIGSDAGFITP